VHRCSVSLKRTFSTPPVEEIFGVELLAPEQQAAAIHLLKGLSLPVAELRALYARWGRVVGIRLTPADLDQVARYVRD